ncbi:hypothetical protein VP01_5426g1 [Puccinia sorghi]|uniref:Uncharacterized protein n=1 Tax=Puccinia sorghi TaxID=27349 RepID=A0A0L6ULR0_9BASI|nr:hypothetical protein VP01_5426g1 [Puccinia sorghi]
MAFGYSGVSLRLTNNVITAKHFESAQKIWLSIKEHFALSQSSIRERIFNEFLYIKFDEDVVQLFVTNIKVEIKKLVNVGIELPQDIPSPLKISKLSPDSQVEEYMHSYKDMTVDGSKVSACY